MSKKTFTCGYCFAYYHAGDGCGCKDAQFDRAKERIKALEGVVDWMAKIFVGLDDDYPIGELCVCYNDPAVGISMGCPLCDRDNPLTEAIEKVKKLEEV